MTNEAINLASKQSPFVPSSQILRWLDQAKIWDSEWVKTTKYRCCFIVKKILRRFYDISAPNNSKKGWKQIGEVENPQTQADLVKPMDFRSKDKKIAATLSRYIIRSTEKTTTYSLMKSINKWIYTDCLLSTPNYIYIHKIRH